MGSYNKFLYGLACKVLIYMYHTLHYGIVYDCSNFANSKMLRLSVWVDADWGAREEDSKSVTGWLMQINDCPIYAVSKVQRRPAVSTAEAECNGVETVCKEIEWVKGLLGELGFQVLTPIPIWEDNHAAIRLSEDPIFPNRTKYYRISQAYVRWCRNTGLIKVQYLESKQHPCDLLNKLVTKPSLKQHLPALMGEQGGKIQRVGKCFMARCKQVCRRVPAHIRYKPTKFKSRSDHDPPLVAVCETCSGWLPWSSRRHGWLSCQEGKTVCPGENFRVFCYMCDAQAIFLPKIISWYCARCNVRKVGKSDRKLRSQVQKYE
jgi:hypothetical protein